MRFNTIQYKKGRLTIIDQRMLPLKIRTIEADSIKDVYSCIQTLAVRGAPAIGVFAAYGLVIGVKKLKPAEKKYFFKQLFRIIDYLKSSRPTAVNLSWALDRMKNVACDNYAKKISTITGILLKEAKVIHREDKAQCEKIGAHGAKLIKNGDAILTHCNAGCLATTGSGTALAVIYKAKQQGKKINVYIDETRPLLQGARLSAWEMQQRGVDITLICDNMSGFIMKQGKVDKVIVGADRIARNGDTANKIGTYSLAVLAKAHNIPFYVAAPSSTFDFTLKNGREIPIEQRSQEEVKKIMNVYHAPKKVKAYNPAFDITPADYISAIITEKGVIERPCSRKLKRLNVKTLKR
jgi:methylthioribose-1-phosphate isomerase